MGVNGLVAVLREKRLAARTVMVRAWPPALLRSGGVVAFSVRGR